MKITCGFLIGNCGADGVDEMAFARHYSAMLYDDLAERFAGATIRVVAENGSGSKPANLATEIELDNGDNGEAEHYAAVADQFQKTFTTAWESFPKQE